jgi:hypothetical protein
MGPQGPAGNVGATGIVSTTTFAGDNGLIEGASYEFTSGVAIVVTNGSQRLTAVATGSFLSASGWLRVGICYQPNGGGSILDMAGESYSTHSAEQFESISAVGSAVPGTGTWKVGMCAMIDEPVSGSIVLSRSNGWVQVTN